MKEHFKHFFIYFVVIVSIVILFKPGSDGPLPFWQADKVIHATTFALLAIGLWLRQVKIRLIFLILFCYATSSEIIQHFFIPGREWDVLDVAADSFGILLVLGLSQWKRND